MRLPNMSLLIFIVAISSVVHAVWKPKGNVHIHESPEYLFREGDTNKDGFLDADELKEFYKHDEVLYHGKEIADHFGGEDKATAALDLDKDGRLSWDEFLEYASPAAALAIAIDDFVLMDIDKNHELSLDEYKNTHYAKERVLVPNDEAYAEHFKQIDKNGDGKIMRDEWLGSEAAQDPFSHMDYNKDRYVTFEEFAQNEKEHYHGFDHDHPTSIELTREAFDKLDENKDGKLTREEDRHKPIEKEEYEKIDMGEEEEEEEEEDEDEDAHNDL